MTTNLLEFDSKVGYIARRECEQIIRRLPNYEEYLHLPEYNELVSLIEKGIAIHHAGVMPVLREMVELLFARGFIKLLFATETFAVGINMPTKTVIFTDVNKFDGNNMRMLYSHEFTQMAGRAGRRGIDTVGNVIHLNNLFKNVELSNYKIMMQGKPQKLISKFKISYNLLLNLIDIGDQNFIQFVKRSMIQEDIVAELGVQFYKIGDLEKEMETIETTMQYMKTPKEVVDRYIQLLEKRVVAVNKTRRDIDKEIQTIVNDHRSIDADTRLVAKYNEKHDNLEKARETFQTTEQFLDANVTTILEFLEKEGFITKDRTATELEPETTEFTYKLTISGFIATHIREIPCLIFAVLLESNDLDTLDSHQLIGIFSCFTNITVADEDKAISFIHLDERTQTILCKITSLRDYYQEFESSKQITTGTCYDIHYDLVDYTIEWANCSSVEECKTILARLEKEKGVFLGEFVKAILKINNISNELEKIAENIGNIALLNKLREIPELTQKFVATNQSLYI